LANRRAALKLAVNSETGAGAGTWLYARGVAAGLIGEVAGVHVAIRWNHGWIAGTAFEAAEDLVLQDSAFTVRLPAKQPRRPSDHDPRDGNAVGRPDRAAAPPRPGLRHLSARQASLVFDATLATARRIRRSSSAPAARSPAPGRTRQATVELHTEAGVVGRPARHLVHDGCRDDGRMLCAIEEDREPLNSARRNLASIAMCQAAVRSSRSGEAVHSDQDKRQFGRRNSRFAPCWRATRPCGAFARPAR